MTVLKASITRPLALAILVALAGCAKKESAPAAGADTAPAPAPAEAAPAQAHPVPTNAAGTEVDLAGIVKAEGGMTVEEIHTQREQLAGTSVTVRGKVVKTNAGIMGKNWLHVRDGSGAEGSNDLTVTTDTDLPEVGSTVLVTGQAAIDKDFGLGYQYDVILEDAQVAVE